MGETCSFTVIPYAAVKVDDYINLAVKVQETWSYFDGDVEMPNQRTEWEILNCLLMEPLTLHISN